LDDGTPTRVINKDDRTDTVPAGGNEAFPDHVTGHSKMIAEYWQEKKTG
jgi:hypothetical protein